MRALVAVALVAAVLVAGCAGASNTSIAGQGSKDGTATKTLKCSDGGGQIAVGVQGEGRITVSVTDGDGSEIFKQSYSGGGQQGETSSISGAKGTWTLRAVFSGSSNIGFSSGYNGQWGITLSC